MDELKKLNLSEYKIKSFDLAKIFNILLELPTKVSGAIVMNLMDEIEKQEKEDIIKQK